MRPRTRMLAVGVIAPLTIAAAAVVAMLLALPDLPAPVAVHWGPSGAPDRFGSPVGPFLIVGLGVVGYSVFAFLLARSERGANARMVLAVAPFLASVLGIISAGGLLIQRGIVDAGQAPSILPVVGLAFGVGVVLAVAAWFVLPPGPPREDVGELPTLDLGSDERATWFARLEPARGLGVLLIVVGAVLLLVGGVAIWIAASVPALVVYLAVMAFLVVASAGSLFWTVRIDSRGLVARSVLGAPRFAVPLENVEAAISVPAGGTAGFGGWGLRWGGPGRVGIILGSGPVLEVRKRDGGTLVVTTPDSQRAAALLNSLAQRVE